VTKQDGDVRALLSQEGRLEQSPQWGRVWEPEGREEGFERTHVSSTIVLASAA
jgi:hypothetical protein